jgi:nitrite reductase (NO-forming)
MIQLGTGPRRRAAVDRRADRLVAMTAIGLAIGFLMLAVLSAFLPGVDRADLWLPIHLALAGAATTAIAGVMPFFSAAIATSQPVRAPIRWVSVAAVALGTAAITLGFPSGALGLATAGGAAFILGVVLVGYATLLPLYRGLGPNGGVVAIGYAAAMVMVTSGAILATLFLAGWQPVLEAWSHLKPAHAWLNLVGFVSLIIATTLLHFFPTVVGARILRVRAAYATPLGLAGGSALVAIGFGLRADLLARAGALLVMVGTAALVAYAWQTWRTRARWSGDLGWHRFATGALVSAISWFVVGSLIGTSRLIVDGAQPAAVSVAPLAGPLVAGWMGLAVLGSATHLVPAIGPGDQREHARQRARLGQLAGARLLAANTGVAGLVVGLLLVLDEVTLMALVLLAGALGLTAVLVVAAVLSGIRNARSASA